MPSKFTPHIVVIFAKKQTFYGTKYQTNHTITIDWQTYH